MKNHSNVPRKHGFSIWNWTLFNHRFSGSKARKKKKTIVAPRRWIDQHDVNWSFGMQLRVYHNIYSIFCITNIYTHISSTDYSTTQNRFLKKKGIKGAPIYHSKRPQAFKNDLQNFTLHHKLFVLLPWGGSIDNLEVFWGRGLNPWAVEDLGIFVHAKSIMK